MTTPLEAIAEVALDFTKPLETIWRDDPADVPEVQGSARRQLIAQLDAAFAAPTEASPLGCLLIGQAGAGKTHLLGALRTEVYKRRGTFVLVDLATSTEDFWQAVAAGVLGSLERSGADGRPQAHRWIDALFARYGGSELAGLDVDALQALPAEELVTRTQQLLAAIGRVHREEALRYQEVVRALLLLASRDFDVQSAGYRRLRGEALQLHGLQGGPLEASERVAGLSWVGSRIGTTVLAFDQLDAVVAESHTARAPAGLLALGTGLMALRDRTRRTLTVLSMIEASWDVLQRVNIAAVTGRFRDPIVLPAVRSGELARKIVEARLAVAYGRTSFRPPYPSWPFRPEAFASAEHRYAREILRDCDAHLRACVGRGQVSELTGFGPADRVPAVVPAAAPAEVRPNLSVAPETLARHVLVVGGAGSGTQAVVRRITALALERQLASLVVDGTGAYADGVPIPDGPPSPDRWFGPSARVNVVQGTDAAWVGGLVRELTTWGGPGPLRGLLVLDDAQQWLALDAVRRMASTTGRFGLVLVVNDPRAVDADLLARVGTQFWGKVSHPAALDVARAQLRLRGGDGQDLPRLTEGTFYWCGDGAPTRIEI